MLWRGLPPSLSFTWATASEAIENSQWGQWIISQIPFGSRERSQLELLQLSFALTVLLRKHTEMLVRHSQPEVFPPYQVSTMPFYSLILEKQAKKKKGIHLALLNVKSWTSLGQCPHHYHQGWDISFLSYYRRYFLLFSTSVLISQLWFHFTFHLHVLIPTGPSLQHPFYFLT